MSKLKEEIYKGELRNLEFSYIAVTLQALWEKGYEPFLMSMLDVDIVSDHTFRITKVGAKWYINCSGLFSWDVNFTVENGKVGGIYISNTNCKRKQLLFQLQDLVLHIFTTYHQNDVQIDFTVN
jgi:hypothetical protein